MSLYPKIFVSYCPSSVPNFMLVSPKAHFFYISARLLFVILENVMVCYGFSIKDAVHKPNLKSTLVNVITQNVESPSTLCATGNHFVVCCSVVCAISHLFLKCMNENVLQSRNEKSKGIQDYECLTFSLITFTFVVLIRRI